MKEKTGKINENELPFIYRLILKLPKISLEYFPDVFHGIFWAIVIPVFLAIEIFLSLFLLISFTFPLNIILTGIIPLVIFVIFIKVMLERFINWWNAIFGKPYTWNIEKAVDEYLTLLRKQNKKER